MKQYMNRLIHRNHKFSTKLIIILVTTNLIISALTGIVTYRVHQSLFNEELSRQHSMHNQQVLARLDSRIKDMYRISNYIIWNPMVKQLISEQQGKADPYKQFLLEKELEKQLQQIRLDAPEIVAIRIYDMKNNQYNLGTFAGSFSYFHPQYLTETLDMLKNTSGEYVWRSIQPEHYRYETNNNWILAARLMKSEDLDTYGTMLILFKTSLFETYLKDLRQQGSSTSYLFDHTDQLIYTSSEQLQPLPYEITELLAQDNVIRKENGESYLYTKQTSDQVQFTLINKASLADVQNRSHLIVKVELLSALASIILFWIIITLVSKQLLRPLKKLVNGMTQLKAGKFDTKIKINSRDELGYIGDRFNQMTEQIDTLIREVYQRELNQRDAELKALQAQLNPHFMYNTLSMFFWKFYKHGDEESAQLVNSLSEMLQYTLGEPQQLSTVRDEIRQIEHYLNIQKARYQHILTTSIEVEESVLEMPMIRLLMQPIVENVFIHAFKNKKNDQVLSISVKRITKETQRPYLEITVKDNGCGMTEQQMDEIYKLSSNRENIEQATRTSLGLKSVIRRIELVHGDPYHMEISSKLGEGSTIILKLPCVMEGGEGTA